jgi:hypothetical protein
LKEPPTQSVDDEATEPQSCYAFRFRAYWFVLAQTEGGKHLRSDDTSFDFVTALWTLDVTRTPFDEVSGNILRGTKSLYLPAMCI